MSVNPIQDVAEGHLYRINSGQIMTSVRVEAKGGKQPGPGKQSVSRKISFPLEALFQSAVQESDNMEICRLLESREGRQLDINHSNHSGLTALHQSVLNDNLDGVKILLCRGADVNKADVNGFAPLHTAAACGFLQIASLLLLFGASSYQVTADGDLAVDLANDKLVVTLLTSEMVHDIQRRTYWKTIFLYYLREYLHTFMRYIVFVVGFLRVFFSRNVDNGQQKDPQSEKKQRTVNLKRPKQLRREKSD